MNTGFLHIQAVSVTVYFLCWPWMLRSRTDISRSANVVTVISKSVFFLLLISKKSICDPSSWCFLTCSGFPLFFWAQSDSRVTAVCFKVLFQEPCLLCVLYSKSILSHRFVVVLLCFTSSQSMFTCLLQSPAPTVSSLKAVHLKSRSGSDNDFRGMLSNYGSKSYHVRIHLNLVNAVTLVFQLSSPFFEFLLKF